MGKALPLSLTCTGISWRKTHVPGHKNEGSKDCSRLTQTTTWSNSVVFSVPVTLLSVGLSIAPKCLCAISLTKQQSESAQSRHSSNIEMFSLTMVQGGTLMSFKLPVCFTVAVLWPRLLIKFKQVSFLCLQLSLIYKCVYYIWSINTLQCKILVSTSI